MATKVGELFVSLAIDAASGNLSVNQLVSALGTLDVVSLGTVGVLTKVGETLYGLGKAAVSTAVEMSALKDITGADPKIVQQWEKAAQRINIHAGSIVSAVRGVNDMMGAIAARKQGPPMELSGWLGITPQKGVDQQGRPVMKNFFDLIGEIANPKNRYWTYTPQVQQQLLGGAFPGGDSKDLFRILNDMRSGHFRPQDIGVLEDKQVADLTKVRSKETELGQTMVGIFDKLILGGNAFAGVLDAVSRKLEWVDRWLASKQGQGAIGAVGASFSDIIKNNGNPFKIGRDAGQAFAEHFFGVQPSQHVFNPSLKLDDLKGVLDINITGAGGTLLGKKTVFLGRGVKNSDVEHITINGGNGGLGQ